MYVYYIYIYSIYHIYYKHFDLKTTLENKYKYIRRYVANIWETNEIVNNIVGFEVKMLGFESLVYRLERGIFLSLRKIN